MTNKPMLSGERELLESAIRILQGAGAWNTADGLRALLDKPVQPVPECVGDLERFEADDGVFVRLGDVIDMLGNERAAQQQGEPVAWVIDTVDGRGADYYPGKGLDTLELGANLYAEPPAPVAVVMPVCAGEVVEVPRPKLCAAVSCPGGRKHGSLFCRLHQAAKSRTTPGMTPSNEALAEMMRADGFPQ